jgi:muramidase (phage lysozyme)
VITGSNETLNEGADASINLNGSDDTVDMANGGYVGLLAGSGNTVNMSSGSVDTLNMSTVSSVILNGSNDTVGAGTNVQINVNGSNDALFMANGDYVGLLAGNGDVVILGSGMLATLNNVTNILLDGSNNTIGAGSGNQISVNGSNNALFMANGDTVGLLAGNDDIVSLNSGMVDTLNDVTNITLNGSNDLIGIGSDVSIIINGSDDSVADGYAGASITVVGSGDVINAAEGDAVTLVAGDSGDTVNMIGGTIVLGANLNNITINGTGDQLLGPDASVAGPVTLATTIITGFNLFTGYTTEPVPAYTPPVIYDPGDIPVLVNYFEANPNLSQDDIQAAESDSNYDTNLATYLNTADIAAMPANVLAMLDGYSSLYLALLGVPASALQEEDEIDQDFAWGSARASVPSDSMLTMLQNLLPALLDTNAATKQDVSDALECLTNAEVNPTQSNIIVMDTAAKLLFEMAEQPDNAKTAPLAEPNYVSLPGLTGPYLIAVQPADPFGDGGTNELIYIKNEDGGFWGEFWNDLDSYVAPVVDALAIIPEPLEPVFAVAAVALDAVQAGQDFASGEDLQGVFNVVAAVGGALDAIGSAAQQAEESAGAEVTDATSNAEVALGSYLSDGVSVAEGIDGIVNGAQTGNALGILTSALGGASGLAGLGGDSSLQQYADVGAALASSAQSLGTGNIVAGLSSLVEAAQTSGVTNIEEDVSVLYDAFVADIYDPTANALTWLVNDAPSDLINLAESFLGITNSNEPSNAPTTIPQITPAAYYLLASSNSTGTPAQIAARTLVSQDLANPAVNAFLKTIEWAEGGGYNVLFGGGTFSDYSTHPAPVVYNGNDYSAAGAYQETTAFWQQNAETALGLTDFSPTTQDMAAAEELNNIGAMSMITQGNIAGAALLAEGLNSNGTAELWAGIQAKGITTFVNHYYSVLPTQ